MKISVIMLTYNREHFIAAAIKSILSQTFDDFEFIIVDNGSSDKSGLIAEKFAKQDSRIKVIHITKDNIGTGRNRGLDLAKGDYIAFIDDDDVAEPDMMEYLYINAIDYKADISICGSIKEVNGEILPNCIFEEFLVMTPEEAIIEMLKRKKFNVGLPTKLIKNRLFNHIRFNNKRNFDDITITYKLIANANRIVAFGKPKYKVVRHGGNNSKFTTNDKLLNPDQLDEYFMAFRERTEYLSKVLPKIVDFVQYSEWSYMISMCHKISKNNLENCKKQLSFVKKELTRHYDDFYYSPYIEEFERAFMRKYIKKIDDEVIQYV